MEDDFMMEPTKFLMMGTHIGLKIIKIMYMGDYWTFNFLEQPAYRFLDIMKLKWRIKNTQMY